ncbi:peptidylglycine alpha-amidating monooxygenase-like isoform X2 [Ostrea edulis]|uniref:peptidylglycine alpha-amidating monooxygenase-like isoform X2 n=1 Tax=Ostrea edulis TaxID=37623 RepID=UPI0020944C57|nr:peptidylglycine alpha-amidating monooxygenase-like isoform X2 [Ostrea edulis]XP_056022423.1 peptidylglycine alpha-amidating monooxygenase-like isoform X2 [Ostrea edulis]XP_056022424.1 peptidylglycine alpha-amidating monooxygenase-like isoform X2 [Ostrea edulis]XP_056022425.1 peptidylglycine alpha-amidating monooxygenase-like isoform X2 [Ostrea edulis]XP_056022426.1 peptidylglycine alpha-amidating monooxygenase-like isoform X2 [Ostrea edulis]XP_056022427.1 peptidylglycine alpha-amidating mon
MTLYHKVTLTLVVWILFVCSVVKSQTLTQKLDLLMKNASVTQNDEYLCSSYKLPVSDQYIVQYEALADAGTAHHILLFGCDEPASTEDYWHCGRLCKSQEQILFAWAKNAPPLQLPKGVGFRVGGQTQIKYIVIQIHYVNPLPVGSLDTSGIRLSMTSLRQRYEAGIYLLLAYSVRIPGNSVNQFADISCQFKASGPIYPFGFRTHAHSLGTVISGYQVNNTYNLIGKGNPQWPQAFYPVEKNIVIQKDDYLVGRCTYNSTGRSRTTFIGATHNDEMCNFYIMYYADRNTRLQYHSCAGNNIPSLAQKLPADSYQPLPPNPLLEMVAHGPSGHMGDPEGHTAKPNPVTKMSTMAPTQKPGPWPTTRKPWPTTGKPETVTHLMDFESDFGGSVGSPTPGSDVVIGQVGGVATDKLGNVYVFHRGGRVWNGLSFNYQNVFQQQNRPIQANCIVVYDKAGQVIRQFGKNMFFMPHGITVDDKMNVWVTDVGLHQIMRFPAGSTQTDLVLGQKFQPGSGNNQFCKPTDVAVLSSGEFFVSDGYCNSRIMKYDKTGSFIKKFGSSSQVKDGTAKPSPGSFNVPHSLTIAEDKGLLCVADRENGRIQCFDFQGNFKRMIDAPEFGDRLFAVSYCPLHGGLLFAVNGPTLSRTPPVQGFIIDINDGQLIETWNAKPGLRNPHDIEVDPVNLRVYVGELDPTKVWRFDMKADDGTGGHGGIIHSGTTPASPETTVNPEFVETQETNKKSLTEEEEIMPAIIIGALLVIPIIIIIVIVIVIRIYKKGQHDCCRRHRSRSRKKFNIGHFLTPHRGFDRLSQEESDTEFDPLNEESDEEEEYSITRKA